MPMLDDAAAIDRHFREYLDDDILSDLPTTIRLAFQAARAGTLAPLAAQAIRAMTLAQAHRFIAGTTPEEAAQSALRERQLHRAFTLDFLGEAVTSDSEADSYASAYLKLIDELPQKAIHWGYDPLIDNGPDGFLPRVNLSLKLSALDSQFDAIDQQGTSERVLSRLRPIWRAARDAGAQIHIDMESYATKDLALSIFKKIAMEKEFRDWPHCGIVIQCYLRDAPRDLISLATWAEQRTTPVWVRLVKGAYWDFETIHSQSAGWPPPVWQNKWETDSCFEKCTTFTLEQNTWLRPAIGSHNIRSLAHAMAVSEHLALDKNFAEMQMLYGMGDAEKKAVTQAGWRMRVYMPYGQLVPGMAYLVRRLLENSSNDSFLRTEHTKHVTAEQLLEVPIPSDSSKKETPIMQKIDAPLPKRPFENQPLTDFSIEKNRLDMQQAIDRLRACFDSEPRITVPLVFNGKKRKTTDRFERRDPSCHRRIIADVCAGSPADATQAIDVVAAGASAWQAIGTTRRVSILRKAASIIKERRFELAALQVFEVGKSWRESDADVAEAIDFCNYYADCALDLSVPRNVHVSGEENTTIFRPRGVAVVIAPWNFPLAILAGMSAATLVTGNTVVLKPAEQSSLVGLRWYEILLEAGVHSDAISFLPARGEVVGPTLVTHPKVDLLAFTGSRSVGLSINQLAAENPGQSIKKVIAELGGKNAIIIDDDADLDEAVLGTVASAFGFQGQKCSACSRVIVLERVYEVFVERLSQAVKSLRIGAADDPSSRIGPLVDAAARDKVYAFIEKGRQTSDEIVSVDPGPLSDTGWFVGPHVFTDVDPASPLAQEEIFGPVLAILRATSFEHAIQLTNDTPYALTAGVFSRSPKHLVQARNAIQAGNVYLNRGCTGALVNRQPFGGYKLSGIGSKTGSPDYLYQFVVPQTITENTMRRGFAP
ncbi:MAG: proline dehydrogenase family protein, partial [Pirellulales bacterium]